MGAHPTTSHCPHCSYADPPDRMTTGEAARYTGVAESTLRYYRHANKGPASYAIHTKVMYDRADLDAWVAAQKAASLRGGGAA